ncbi:glycosyltransferase [Mucilaginibacter gotjawali]|uniref:UDP:flavonoid glycosyltransferase YjiC (YdhE family) n=1 Tax=Mucilaginibacter gotjawali TaxID=1550579 RepID=A0A839SG54_9SPHI|nr:glycosyltransferase [Mucilaginibacter gotjawali]MBB3056786.1 UDP:flavonoid glycosyltransferase YjiC (YdhE family) [Mucilaginibacter gotjawali]
MNIGIFTYGTRGDVQPYIAMALGLMAKGHRVTIAAPENFASLIEGFGIAFHPLYGNAEEGMNSPLGQSVLRSENTIKLMKYFFEVLRDIKTPLRKSYLDGFDKVDFIIANLATLQITSAIAEKQNKKIAFTYFMPPVVPTSEFPLADFDFLNFPWYNKLTYKLAYAFYWKFIKEETVEFREELGLPVLKESLVTHIGKQKLLDLYCLSPTLIPQPKDWDENHKITGFLTVPKHYRENHPPDEIPQALNHWLTAGEKPIYMGFGSNGVGNTAKFVSILNDILAKTNERVLFCTGWGLFDNLPVHENLFVTKYVNHEAILPKCKAGIFHGGAGTLAAMLRNHLPVIIISFYTDQPTWGKIIERMNLGVHIPVKKLNLDKLLAALKYVQADDVKRNVAKIGQQINNEKGLENVVREIELYFNR